MTDGESQENITEDLRTYELGYLLVPAVAEGELPEKVATIKDYIAKNGGTVLEQEDPDYRELAYPMEHVVNENKQIFKNGYFGWIQFEAPGDTAQTLRDTLNQNAEVIRFLCIKIDRDQIGKEVEIVEKDEESADDSDESTEEGDSEEIDEAIDELVIE